MALSMGQQSRISSDTRVIIANIFDPICGDDHPCISRSGSTQAVVLATGGRA
jgi:hypothetical protein